jgi:hypothetical protein
MRPLDVKACRPPASMRSKKATGHLCKQGLERELGVIEKKTGI